MAASDQRSRLMEHLALYAGFGWHIFPLAYRDKTPIQKGGFHNATTDWGKIKEWWGGGRAL